MSRNVVSLSGENLNISEIWDWYLTQEKSLIHYRKQVISAAVTNTNFDIQFIGSTPNDINEYFNNLIEELELLVSFNIVASTEGKIREDFVIRVSKKLKDNISKKYWKLFKEFEWHVPLDENGILEVWIDIEQPIKSKVSLFRGLLKFRHWMAHGRYWRKNYGREYPPILANKICKELIDDFSFIDNWN